MVLLTLWWTFGFNFILYTAAIQDISEEVYEAAAIDGAWPWQQIRPITVPLLRPTMSLVLILQVLASLKVFDQIYILLAGGPNYTTRPVIEYIYDTGFTSYRGGYAAAATMVYFVILVLISTWFLIRNRRGTSGRKGRRPCLRCVRTVGRAARVARRRPRVRRRQGVQPARRHLPRPLRAGLAGAVPVGFRHVIAPGQRDRGAPHPDLVQRLELRRLQVRVDASPIGWWYVNSFIISTLTVIFTVVVCSMAAFALAHLNFRGKYAVFGLIFAGLMLPTEALVLPQFMEFRALHLLGTYWAIILPRSPSRWRSSSSTPSSRTSRSP